MTNKNIKQKNIKRVLLSALLLVALIMLVPGVINVAARLVGITQNTCTHPFTRQISVHQHTEFEHISLERCFICDAKIENWESHSFLEYDDKPRTPNKGETCSVCGYVYPFDYVDHEHAND